MISACVRRGVTAYQGDMMTFMRTFPDAHFDRVICSRTLEEVGDPAAVIAGDQATPDDVERIRASRARPGLMRQHLTCVRAAKAIGLTSGGLGCCPGNGTAGAARCSDR